MLAIIPARGGSKGLPGKNTKLLLGKPLIAYTIEAAKNAAAVSEVIVSTDYPDIAQIAQEFGAGVPFLRPSELATDTSSAIDTYLYTIAKLEADRGKEIKEVLVLLPTCPLRNSRDIENAVRLFRSRDADSVISYTEEHHPLHWHKYIESDLSFRAIWQDDTLKNRQEFEKSYYPNGAIYVFKKNLLAERKYYSGKSYAYIMPRNRSIDIDTQEDFDLAEYYLGKYGS